MLKYLVVILDDTSTSFCHYDVKRQPNLMPEKVLHDGILFAMKENLTIQFVYPEFEIPERHKFLIESVDHSKIKPASCSDDADVVVFNKLNLNVLKRDSVCVLLMNKNELFGSNFQIRPFLEKTSRLNIVIKDVDSFTELDFQKYKTLLALWGEEIRALYLEGKSPQFNLLTDRIILDKMNNCNAGDETITLAPDGKFYVCPAFYYENLFSIGSLSEGLVIKNKQLYNLNYAPICRKCDSYQCKRCVYLNQKTTFEVNTPSHEQCVVAHLERNISRQILFNLRTAGEFLPDREIKELNYLDPFEVIVK